MMKIARVLQILNEIEDDGLDSLEQKKQVDEMRELLTDFLKEKNMAYIFDVNIENVKEDVERQGYLINDEQAKKFIDYLNDEGCDCINELYYDLLRNFVSKEQLEHEESLDD